LIKGYHVACKRGARKVGAKEKRVKMLAPKNRYGWELEKVTSVCFEMTLMQM